MELNAWAFSDTVLKLMGVPKRYLQPWGSKAIDSEFDRLRARVLGCIAFALNEARYRKVRLEPLFFATFEVGDDLPPHLNWLKDYSVFEVLSQVDSWINSKYS